jgi:hypothetical protein
MISLIWAPEDCHVIEFQFTFSSTDHTRSATVMAQWGKTRIGEIMLLEPQKDQDGRMKVPMKDLLQACKFFLVIEQQVDIKQILQHYQESKSIS